MAATKKVAKAKVEVEEEVDYSLNDLLLRGRVSAPATTKELPSGDKVVEFRLIISINFLQEACYVIWFGTHKEYDKINVETIVFDTTILTNKKI